MLKKMLFAAVCAMVVATPALAEDYYSQYDNYWRTWHPYPNYAAAIPYGLVPIIAYTRTTAYLPALGYAQVPVRVYFIPQQTPLYNVPPYTVVEPF